MVARQLIPYFRHARVEITIVVDGDHAPIAPRHPAEVLIVRDPWYPEVPRVAVSGHKRRQRPYFESLYFLSNTDEIHRLRLAAGFNSHHVNLGCFVDPDVFAPASVDKRYDAVMSARFSYVPVRQLVKRRLHRARYARGLAARLHELAGLRHSTGRHREAKRHWLTEKIRRLALLDPDYGTDSPAYKQRYSSRRTARSPTHSGSSRATWRPSSTTPTVGSRRPRTRASAAHRRSTCCAASPW